MKNKILLFVGFLLSAILFQNCNSQIRFEQIDLNSNSIRDVDTELRPANSFLLSPGLDSQELKTFFIVDDSYTMSQSQTNLSKGVAQMFQNLQSVKMDVRISSTSFSRVTNSDFFDQSGLYMNEGLLSNYSVGQKFFRFNGSTNYLTTQFQISPLLGIQTYQNQVIKVKEALMRGTRGQDTEIGLNELLMELSSQNYKRFLNKDDKALIVIISDEDDQTTQITETYNSYEGEVVSNSIEGGDIYAAYLKVWTVQVEFEAKKTVLKDAISLIETESGKTFFHPQEIFGANYNSNLISNLNCPDMSLIQNKMKARYPHLFDFNIKKCFVLNQSDFKYGSFGFRASIASYKKFPFGSVVDSCDDFEQNTINDPNAYLEAFDFIDKSNLLITACDVKFYTRQETFVARNQKLTLLKTTRLTDELLKSLPQYTSSMISDKTQFKNFMVDSVEYKLKELFGEDGFFISFIVNDSSCELKSGQSVGSQFIRLANKLGGNAQVIPICDPSKYGQALNHSALSLKSVISRTLRLPKAVKEVSKIIILRGSQRIEVLKSDYKLLKNDIIEFKNDILQKDDQVQVEY